MAPAHGLGADDDGGVAAADGHLGAERVAAEGAVDREVDDGAAHQAGADGAGRLDEARVAPRLERLPAQVEGGAALGGAVEVRDAAEGALDLAHVPRRALAFAEALLEPLDGAGGRQHAHLGLVVATEGVGVGGPLELAGLLQLARHGEHLALEEGAAALAQRVEGDERLPPAGLPAQILALGALGGEGAEGDALLHRGLGVGAEQEDPGRVVREAGLHVEIRRLAEESPAFSRSRASLARRPSRFPLDANRSKRPTTPPC